MAPHGRGGRTPATWLASNSSASRRCSPTSDRSCAPTASFDGRARLPRDLVELSAATPELRPARPSRTSPSGARPTARRRAAARRAAPACPRDLSNAGARRRWSPSHSARSWCDPRVRPTVDRRRGPARPRDVRVLNVVRDALDTAVAVSAGAERLEELDGRHLGRRRAWPQDSTVRLDHVTIDEEDATLVEDATLRPSRPVSRVALTGPSGSGKSTLLRAMGALDDVEQAVTYRRRRRRRDRRGELRRHVAYVASEPGLTRGYALDVVNLGRDDPRPVDDLAALGHRRRRDTRWEELSRGERARVAIARAMVTESRDSTCSTSPRADSGRRDRRRAVTSGSTGASVIVATHDPR
jgi:ABC-type ATPase involved in cell division